VGYCMEKSAHKGRQASQWLAKRPEWADGMT
jgi:hypothetical protein